MERDSGRTQEPGSENLESPSAGLEETLEQHVGVYPGEAALIGHAAEHEPSEHSYWPFVVASSVLLIGIGFLSTIVVSVIGALLLLGGLVGWFSEPWVS